MANENTDVRKVNRTGKLNDGLTERFVRTRGYVEK